MLVHLMKPMLRVLFITGVAGAGAVALFLLIFIHPRDPALTNQNEILGLLGRASPVPTSRLNLEVRSVVLAERITLFPGRTQAVFGYSLRLTVRSTNFTIDAEPLIPGKTGV